MGEVGEETGQSGWQRGVGVGVGVGLFHMVSFCQLHSPSPGSPGGGSREVYNCRGTRSRDNSA